MSLCHQHDFVGGKWCGKDAVRQGRNTRHNILVAFETSGGLGQTPDMRIDAQNLVFQTGLEATHNREDHDQDHDTNGNPAASPFTALGLLQRSIQDYTVSNSYTKIISPALVNELRGGLNYEYYFSSGRQTLAQFMQSVGLNDAQIQAYGNVVGPSLLTTPGQIAINFGNFQGIGNGGRSIYRPLDQRQPPPGGGTGRIHLLL